MKRNIHILFTACLLLFAVAMPAQTVAQSAQDYALASDYTDCNKSPRFSIPLDIEVTESYWLKGYVQDLDYGVSAYLYSDTDFLFEVYINCFWLKSVYETTFKKNKTSTINFAKIQEKLAENGISDYTSPIYIRITPKDGEGGRLVMRPDSERMYSDCDNPLYLAPGLNLRSYRTSDVYALDPRDFAHDEDLFVKWYTKDSVSCQAKMTLGACDGQVLDEKTMLKTKDVFRITPEILSQAAQENQLLYFHFNHEVDSTSYVQCLASKFTEKVYEKTACQGKGVTIGDTTFYESTYYFRDTAYMHTNLFYIRYYNITITEPEPQPDTLGLKSTQLPYTYRGQIVTDYGDYDFTISKAKQCDERCLLHVYHDVDTIVNVKDTFLCYGASFKYQGKLYSQDVSFGQAVWKNQDTLLIDSLHVRFASTPEIVYDTIMQNQTKYGKTYKQSGEFRFTYANPNTYCVDSIILLVKPNSDLNIQYDYYYIDITLCQGMEYEDYYGNVYTESTVLYDTIPRVMNKHYEVEITTITFTEPEIQYDTISLKTTDLPYTYREQYIVEDFGGHDVLIHTSGSCDEHYQLLVLHDIDTLTQSLDTTLCQGKTYLYNGVEYTTDTTLIDTLQLDADTYQILTIQVSFLVPDIQPDTISLKTTYLPYTYREQYVVEDFGEHDVLIHTPGTCDERYQLTVQHDIDTTYQTLDTTLCQGKTYLYNGVEYSSDMTLVDTLQLDADTYQILTIQVAFTAPDIQPDTLSLKTTDLPYTYREQYTVDNFGEHDVLIHNPGSCDERYQLQVLHDVDTLTQSLNTTLCQGKTYLYNGVEYTTDTTLIDTLQLDADTYQILTIHVAFTAPDIQSDTLGLKTTDLPYTYREQYIVETFGWHDVLIHTPGACDERYQLSVLHDIDTTYQTLDTTLCQGKAYLYNGVEYTTDTTLIDTLQLDADTYQILTIQVAFTAPDLQMDTLSIKTTDLPYTYREQYTVETFGDHDVLIHTPGTCDERYQLQVLHDIDTLVLEADTFLCYGNTFVFETQEYQVDTVLQSTSWLNDDILQIDILNISFATQPIELYDTLLLAPTELPYLYRDTLLVTFGEYELLIYNHEGCLELIYLSVQEKTPTSLDDTPIYDRPRLILRNGVVYVLRGSEVYTLLGERL